MFYMDIVAMPIIAVYMYIFIEGRKVTYLKCVL